MFQSTPPTRAATARVDKVPHALGVSIHAAHAGGDPELRGEPRPADSVSIHAAHAGGDGSYGSSGGSALGFNPRRPRGRRRSSNPVVQVMYWFQSTPPTRAATVRRSQGRR